MNKMKIAIIGAGWTGISCLNVLRQKGYMIDVFEKNNDLEVPGILKIITLV